jgi:D-lactate dehydrogenase
MNITFSEVEKWEEPIIKEKLRKHKITFLNQKINERNVNNIKNSEILALFINSKINKEILDKMKNLKFIATMSTGYDHINLEECKKRKINVSNVPSYGENTVAEHTFALLLALSRNIDEAVDRTKENDFSLHGLKGFDLKGKTIGVIGSGKIGSSVVRIANGFDMKILVYDKNKNKELEKKYSAKYVSLDNLLKKSDIITLHLPLLTSTKHLLNMENIKKIKRGAYLINTARGSLIDTKALLYGLENGIIKGAGLDVLEGEEDIKEEGQLLKRDKECDWECLIRNHMIIRRKNVIVTPHSAFYSKEALERILDTTFENIESYLKGRIKNKIC